MERRSFGLERLKIKILMTEKLWSVRKVLMTWAQCLDLDASICLKVSCIGEGGGKSCNLFT